MGGGKFVNYLSINLQMEIETLKAYQSPAIEVMEMELEQNVLNDVSGYTSTEELNETTFEW